MHIIVFAIITIVALLYGMMLMLKNSARREQAALTELEERLAGMECEYKCVTKASCNAARPYSPP